MAASNKVAFEVCPQRLASSGKEGLPGSRKAVSALTFRSADKHGSARRAPAPKHAVGGMATAPLQLFNWPARKNAADFDTVLAQRLRQCELSPLAKPLAPVQSGSAKVHYASPKFTNSPSASCLPPPPEEWLRGHRAPNVQRSAMADGTSK